MIACLHTCVNLGDPQTFAEMFYLFFLTPKRPLVFLPQIYGNTENNL